MLMRKEVKILQQKWLSTLGRRALLSVASAMRYPLCRQAGESIKQSTNKRAEKAGAMARIQSQFATFHHHD